MRRLIGAIAGLAAGLAIGLGAAVAALQARRAWNRVLKSEDYLELSPDVRRAIRRAEADRVA